MATACALLRSACNTKKLLVPANARILQLAYLQDLKPPPKYDDVEFPPMDGAFQSNKLKVMQRVPTPPANIKPPTRMGTAMEFKRGPEEVHNYFLHKQFGIVALQAGMLKFGHFEMIRNTINRELVPSRMFAIWRVDPPWWPVTKHTGRMGGGKGSINHYGTPLKAGRVIIEIGGQLQYEEVKRIMENVAARLPFKAVATTHRDMETKKLKAARKEELNLNPFDMKYIIRNNMGGCSKWLSPYDYRWFCKYR